MQTVSACDLCNGLKADFDGALRDYLAADVDSSQHAKAAALLEDVMRAISGKHTDMFNRFYEGRSIPLFDRDGHFEAMGWEVPLGNNLAHIEAVNWITRGMHWVVFGERTHPKTVDSRLVDRYRRRTFLLESAIRGANQGHFQQGEQYACTYAQSVTGRVLWQHIFFDSVLFVSQSQRP